MHFTRLAIPTVASLVAVQAHPGHDIKEEIAHMARAHEFHKRDISSCYSKLKARGHHQRTPIEDTRSSRTSEPSVVSPLMPPSSNLAISPNSPPATPAPF